MTLTAATSNAQETFRLFLRERPEHGKPLGRHVEHDPRSRNYPAQRSGQLRSIQHSPMGLPLTQDDSHTCSTAHSLCAVLNSWPNNVVISSPLTEKDAIRIYRTARGLDIDMPVAGSSGLMASKAAASLGLIQSYEHAFGLSHALEALVLRPVMTGFHWYASFDSPDPVTGLVQIVKGARIRGGHEVAAHGIDLDAGVVWFWNSWGPRFGLGGRFCMTFETWGRLLQEEGDVTVPVV
jgi:hypothetical protein